MNFDNVVLNKERNVYLVFHIVDEKKRPVVLILPGGSYTECSAEGEAPLAERFNELGYNAVVLSYSVGKYYSWPRPLEDFDCAMEYLIKNEDKYHLDSSHIFALGLSAGGHLASVAATSAKHKPFGAILCYAATKDKPIQYTAPNAPDVVSQVDKDTSACFIVGSRNDWIVPISNSLSFINALEENYVDYEVHIYSFGMHGYSFGKGAENDPHLYCKRIEDWVSESVSWMNERVSGEYVSIREGVGYNDKYSEVFTVKNSMRVLLESKECLSLFKEKFPLVLLIYEKTKETVTGFVDGVSLSNLILASSFLGVSLDTSEIEEELNKIKRSL